MYLSRLDPSGAQGGISFHGITPGKAAIHQINEPADAQLAAADKARGHLAALQRIKIKRILTNIQNTYFCLRAAFAHL